MRRNRNRGYQQLKVWQDAIEYYGLTSRVFRAFPYDLKRVASQAIASSDSVHRNIAEGYCRRSLNEYLYHLNVALGSLGESVSGVIAYRQAEQVNEANFEALDSLAYRTENRLIKLVESLERKRDQGDWIDHMTVGEDEPTYDTPN